MNGKLEVTIKLNELPQMHQSKTQCHFKVSCDGRVFQVSVNPKQWSKLETANATYPEWVAAVSGKLGSATADGFVLEEASVHVYETKAKASAPSKQPCKVEPSNAEGDVMTTTAQEAREKPTAPASTISSREQPKPKQIGKFKVQVR